MTHFTVRERASRALVLTGVALACLASAATVASAQGYRRAALTGTYQLNTAQSDNAVTIADQISNTLPAGDRPRLRTTIMRRLEAPDSLAIDRQGRTITMASSNADRVSFDADGRVQTE